MQPINYVRTGISSDHLYDNRVSVLSRSFRHFHEDNHTMKTRESFFYWHCLFPLLLPRKLIFTPIGEVVRWSSNTAASFVNNRLSRHTLLDDLQPTYPYQFLHVEKINARNRDFYLVFPMVQLRVGKGTGPCNFQVSFLYEVPGVRTALETRTEGTLQK